MPQSSSQNSYVLVQPAQTPQPIYTQLGPSIATILIAAFAVWISYRQYKISKQQADISERQAQTSLNQAELAKKRLKLDLFERRMEIYRSVKETIGTVAGKGTITNDDMLVYLTGVQSAKWLFGNEVSDYLETDFWKFLVDLQLHDSMSHSSYEKERTKAIFGKCETIQKLVGQYKVLDDLMRPYLVLEH